MFLEHIIPGIKEAAFGKNGVITNLRNGNAEMQVEQMNQLRILFEEANKVLRTNFFMVEDDFSDFSDIIITLRHVAIAVPWAGQFSDELMKILSYKGY